jgi:hypothetical protein
LASLSPKANITTDGTDTGEAKKKEIVAKRDTQPAVKTAEAQTAANEKEQAKEPPREAAARPAKSVAADRVDQSKAKPDSNTVAPAGGAGGGGRVATRRRAEESKDDAVTRSVAGRKFRKDGGIWTDTAYDSSTRTVNMARGSEQFRALVSVTPSPELSDSPCGSCAFRCPWRRSLVGYSAPVFQCQGRGRRAPLKVLIDTVEQRFSSWF